MPDQTTVIPLPPREGLAARVAPAMNRSLMVMWINGDLIARADNDVNKSMVFYDADGDFVHAIPAKHAHLVTAEILQKLFNNSKIRFYSTGVK